MDDQELRELIAAIKAGRFSRRDFIRGMVGLGLTAPLASQLLVHAGLAQSSTPIVYKPTRAGGGGALRTLFWQAPTSLNPHFAVGAKDVEGAGIFYEPLTSWDPDGNLVPMLAAEIPNIENGGVAADGMSVTWKLKTGVQWHDGRPLPPTTSYSIGNTPPTRRPPRPRLVFTRTSRSKRSIPTPSAFASRSRHRSGQVARTL